MYNSLEIHFDVSFPEASSTLAFLVVSLGWCLVSYFLVNKEQSKRQNVTWNIKAE